MSGSNLPAQLTTLIGREREVAAAREMLLREAVRLVTITGPGGVGKSRIGLRVAQSLIEEFAGEVRLVPLAPIKAPQLVLPTIAGAMGLSGPEERAFELLAEHLRERRSLLFLDNFEQVVEAAPSLSELLFACPKLKMLVTSRELLRLSVEREFPVPPLGLPDPEDLPPHEELAGYPAVDLFVERAQNPEPGFRLTEENAAVVAGICVRLDGLPLAIELAAARLGMLTPEELLERLDRHGLELLSGGARDLPERQRTLRAAMDWSYDLLDDFEKSLFRRFSVFVRGCSPEAVETMYVAAGELPSGVLDGLGSLVDKNLLRRTDLPNGSVRLGMLETVREYALELLAASGEEESVREAHAIYCLSLAEELASELAGEGQSRAFDRIETEYDNLRAALSWALEAEDAALGLRLAVALERFWLVRGRPEEGVLWLVRLMEMDAAKPLRARALASAGRLALRREDPATATLFLEEAISLFREATDEEGVVSVLDDLGVAATLRGENDRAGSLLEESLATRRKLGDERGAATALAGLGNLALASGDADRASELHGESVRLRRGTKDKWGLARSLLDLGNAEMARGAHEKAASVLEESAALFGELKDAGGLASATAALGFAALQRSPSGPAEAAFRRALSSFVGRGEEAGVARCLEGLARLAEEGEPERAARLRSAARTLSGCISPESAGYAEPVSRKQALAEARAEAAGRRPDFGSLTPREAETLRLVAAGMDDARAAREMSVSPRTVGAHVRAVCQKLGVASRAEAVRLVHKHGFT